MHWPQGKCRAGTSTSGKGEVEEGLMDDLPLGSTSELKLENWKSTDLKGLSAAGPLNLNA